MANLDQLKQKYQPVLNAIQSQGGQIQSLSQEGDQLVLTATVPSEDAKNRIWDAIKSVDSSFADLKHNITVVPGSGTQREQMYIVQPGDNLSKISKQFYGDPSNYKKIAEANGISDPNKIKVGERLKIPA